jgi:hypothetical protein
VEHPKDIGDRSTLAIMLALGDAGFEVLLPFGENTRYDLAIRRDNSFELVQCKTGRLQKGAVIFRTASSYYHHPHPLICRKRARRIYESTRLATTNSAVFASPPTTRSAASL